MSRHPRVLAVWVTLIVGLAASAVAQTPPAPVSPTDPPPIDVAGLKRALAANPTGATATALVDKLRQWLGSEVMSNGMGARTDGTDVAFIIEAPGAKAVTARSPDGVLRQPLVQVGGTGVWAAVATLTDGTAVRCQFDVDGRRIGNAGVEAFTIHPDSLPRSGVPRGKVVPQKRFASRIFAGTERDWWIYVPAQARPGTPVAVMVFQDGGPQFLKAVPPVFDNLIHKGDMPVTAAVFLNPGVFADGRRNRDVEYDTLSPDYARFVVEEIFPEVEKTVKLRKDPESRAIAGMSSGGICAFTAAWERPDQFRKVLSFVGSFTNIAAGPSQHGGGHNYPPLVRKLPRKPIRVFLQDGDQDQEEESGYWPLGNREMEKALIWSAYDARVVWGHGFHSTKHGLAILPDALRWLWRDHASRP